MKKWTKITLIISLCFIGAGIAVSFTGYTMNGSSADNPEELRYKKVSKEINEDFTKINISVVNDSIEFLPSESDQCYIECYDSKKAAHDISVSADMLSISSKDNRQWYEYVFSSFQNHKQTAKLGGEIHAETVNGNIDINNIESAGYVNLETVNGNINVSGKNADELTAETVNGNITAELTVKGLAQVTNVNGTIDTRALKADKIDKYSENGSVY